MKTVLYLCVTILAIAAVALASDPVTGGYVRARKEEKKSLEVSEGSLTVQIGFRALRK